MSAAQGPDERHRLPLRGGCLPIGHEKCLSDEPGNRAAKSENHFGSARVTGVQYPLEPNVIVLSAEPLRRSADQ